MTETSSISRFVARRTGQRSDPGREALGQGLANVAVAFVGGYPVCASLSGTSVNLAGGARGPRPIYFFTLLALLVALSLGPLFAYLPRFALAAVVIMAVASLLDLRRLLARLASFLPSSMAMLFDRTPIISGGSEEVVG
jgi:SulP family sulfate permease